MADDTTDLTAHRSVMTHRALIRQALTVFKDACTKTMKAESNIGNDTSETEDKIEACDHLLALLTDQRDLLLDGTPMGDAMTRAAMVDDDGQSLTVDSLGELLEAAGVTEWAGEIVAQWTLEQRKEVAAWARAAQRAQTDDKVSVPPRPTLVPDEWLSDALLKAEQAFRERNPLGMEDVEAWINRGPWGVRSYPSSNPSASEWEIVRVDPDSGQVTDTFSRVYDDLDQARERAAWFNKQAAEAPQGDVGVDAAQFDAALAEAGLVDKDGLIVDASDGIQPLGGVDWKALCEEIGVEPVTMSSGAAREWVKRGPHQVLLDHAIPAMEPRYAVGTGAVDEHHLRIPLDGRYSENEAFARAALLNRKAFDEDPNTVHVTSEDVLDEVKETAAPLDPSKRKRGRNKKKSTDSDTSSDATGSEPPSEGNGSLGDPLPTAIVEGDASA